MGNAKTESKKNDPIKNEMSKNSNIISISVNDNINIKNSQINVKANPVKKKKKKKAYDFSQFEIREQIQESFIETIPIKVRKQDPSYFELKNGKISIVFLQAEKMIIKIKEEDL